MLTKGWTKTKVHTEIERDWKSVENSFLYSLVIILRDTSNKLSLNEWNTADTGLNTNQYKKKQSPNESTETEVLY